MGEGLDFLGHGKSSLKTLMTRRMAANRGMHPTGSARR